MNWTELLKTVATLGLGAVIAGAFALVTARFTHERDARARYSTRRRDHIEKLLEALVQIELTYMKQKTALENYKEVKASNPQKAAKEKAAFDALNLQLVAKLQTGPRISSFLLLLGEAETDTLFWKYLSALTAWHNKSIQDLDELSASALQDIRKRIRAARETLLAEMAKAYKTD